MKKDPVYRLDLKKATIVMMGELEKGDVDVVRKWLRRIESGQKSQEKIEQRKHGNL